MAPKVDVKELCGIGTKMSNGISMKQENNKECVCTQNSSSNKKVSLKQENSRPKYYRSMSACDVNLNEGKSKQPHSMKTETPPTSLSNLKEKKSKSKHGSTPHIDQLSKDKTEKHKSPYSKLMFFWKKFHKSLSSKFFFMY